MTATVEMTGRESRRFLALKIARELAKEPADSLVAPLLLGYLRALSWLPAGEAEEVAAGLVVAVRQHRMGDVSAGLNALLAGVE